MIIVLFHVLYLFGKLIYTRYNRRRQAEDSDDINVVYGYENMSLPSRKRNFGLRKIAQPPGDTSDDEKDSERTVKFFPPAYIQRYVAVQAALEDARYKGKLHKVVDFGCAELGFLVYLKNTPGVEEILCVDVDRELLQINQRKAQPLHVDYLHTRDLPLLIRILEGSVTQNDECLKKTDAVICIELIEHLYPETLNDLPYNIFGYIKPQVAIMTTPNVEFNVLFKKTGFRHYDHKFEWTREQFKDWAENIVSRYPEYEVSITGICKGPPGSEGLGCCSQMAIFHRHSILKEYVFPGVEGLFRTVSTHEYPFRVDNRSDEQKILDDAIYFIRSYSMYSLEFSEEVPLAKLIDPLKKYHVTINSLKELLNQNRWTVVDREKGPVVLITQESSSESNSDRESWNDSNLSWNEEDDNYENGWDDDPGPPSHYTEEQLAQIAAPRENWDEPSIFVERVNEESTVPDNVNGSSIEVEGPSNSNPPTSIFKEVLNHAIELSPQQLPVTDNESPLRNNRSENNSSERSSSRKIYQKMQKKAEVPSRSLLNELGSLCSMYLEPSSNENSKTSFKDLSNRSFESTISATSSTNDSSLKELFDDNGLDISAKKLRVDDSFGSFSSAVLDTPPQFASSPRTAAELKRKCKKNEDPRKQEEILSEAEFWEGMATPESVRTSSGENLLRNYCQTSLQTSSIASISTSSAEESYSVEVSSTCQTLVKDKNDETEIDSIHLSNQNTIDDSRDSQESSRFIETTLLNNRFSSNESRKCDSHNDGACSIEKKEFQSELRKFKNIKRCRNSDSDELMNPIKTKEFTLKSEIPDDECKNIRDEPESKRTIIRSRTDYVSKDFSISKALDFTEILEVKAISPETLDTPPNSWSPEVMDSGYPNSASAHDMTPEYDLPSIAHDRIADDESPSIEEAPRPGILELAEVENGDLANNNRDDEGNNMIAVQDNEEDDLQPLINVLEDDMENENDIYVLQNGFPVWLLRILQMQGIDMPGHIQPLYGLLNEAAGGGDADAEFDEGFSISSDEDVRDVISQNL